MKIILTSLVLVVLIFPTLALSREITMDDLSERGGLYYYKNDTEVPFNGRVTGQQQGYIEDGKQDGPWVGYHDNGQLMFTVTFKHGMPDGPWVLYHDNGQALSKGTY